MSPEERAAVEELTRLGERWLELHAGRKDTTSVDLRMRAFEQERRQAERRRRRAEKRT